MSLAGFGVSNVMRGKAGGSSGTGRSSSRDLCLLGVDGADESIRKSVKSQNIYVKTNKEPSREPTLTSSSSSSSKPSSIGGGVLHISGGIDLSILLVSQQKSKNSIEQKNNFHETHTYMPNNKNIHSFFIFFKDKSI